MRLRFPSRRPVCAAVALVLATALGACAAPSGEIDGNIINVGTIPNPSDVAIYLGNDVGYFQQAGLDVRAKSATGFSPNLAAVVNGENQVGFAAMIPLLVARSKGAPIKIIGGADRAPDVYDAKTDPDRVFVRPSSDIDSPRDLEGKTVAVNALGSIQDLGIRIMVQRDGGDPDKVKFLTLASNDMVASLKSERVDAAALSEPFSTVAAQAELKPIFSYVTSPTPGMPVGAYFTSELTAQKNPEVMDAFVAALTKSNDLANRDPAAVRRMLGEYTKIPPNAISQIHTFEYSTEITREDIDTLSRLLVEFGYTRKPVSYEEVMR